MKLKELLAKATPLPHSINRYDHGGGRVFIETPERKLIADYYDEANRELYIYLRNHAEAYVALEEAARELVINLPTGYTVSLRAALKELEKP
jgi:hypothetical protein